MTCNGQTQVVQDRVFVSVGQQNPPQSLMADYSKAWEDYYKKQSTLPVPLVTEQ